MKTGIITLGLFLLTAVLQGEEPDLDALLTSGLNNQTTPRSLMESPEQVVSRCTQQLDQLADSAKRHQLLCDRAEANILLANLPAADEDVQAVLENEPNSFRALFLKAQIHRKRNQKQAALELCNQLLLRAPESAPLLTLRAATRLPLRGPIDVNVRDQVVQDTTAALKSDPTYYRAYLIRGIAYEYSRDLDSALEDVDFYLKHRLVGTPGYENLAYLIKSRIHYTRRNWPEAIHYSDIALQIDPDSFPAALAMWFSFLALEDGPNAFKAARAMHRIDSGHAYTPMAMGGELYRRKEYAEAIPFLEKWSKSTPKSGRVPMKLAIACRETGQYQAAKKSYGEAIRREPEVAIYRLFRANFTTSFLNENREDLLQATEDVNALLLRREKLNTPEHILAAFVLVKTGKKDEAISIAKAALNSGSATPEETQTLRTLLGFMQKQNGNRAQDFLKLAENMDLEQVFH